MPSPAQSALRQLGDFTSSYRFELIVEFPAAVTGVGQPEVYNILCESAEMPKRTVTPVEIFLHGFKHKRPGRSEVNGTIVLTFDETVAGNVFRLKKAWRDAIWEPDTGIQQPYANLITDGVELHLLNQQNEPWWRFQLLGAYQEDEEGGTLDGTTGDPLKPTLTIGFDDFADGALAA